MFEGIKNWFINGGWDKLYYGYAILIIVTIVLITAWNALDRKQKKRFLLIKNASIDETRTVGKVCYFALKGTNEKPISEIEYIYTVDGKPYYLCYQINYLEKGSNSDEDYFHPDELVSNLYGNTMIYYEKNNPEKAAIKLEAFVSPEVLNRVKSKKTNRYRDITKDWMTPIDLRKKEY